MLKNHAPVLAAGLLTGCSVFLAPEKIEHPTLASLIRKSEGGNAERRVEAVAIVEHAQWQSYDFTLPAYGTNLRLDDGTPEGRRLAFTRSEEGAWLILLDGTPLESTRLSKGEAMRLETYLRSLPSTRDVSPEHHTTFPVTTY